MIHKLSPPPKLQGSRPRSRKAESAVVVTSSPFKQRAMEKELVMNKKKRKSQSTVLNLSDTVTTASHNTRKGTKPSLTKGKSKGGEAASKKGKTKESSSLAEPTSKKRRRQKTLLDNTDETDDEDESWPCLICGDCYSKPREKWIQCLECKLWAHEVYTAGDDFFTCPNCNSDL